MHIAFICKISYYYSSYMYCTNTCLYTTEEQLESICVSSTNLLQNFPINMHMYVVKMLKNDVL